MKTVIICLVNSVSILILIISEVFSQPVNQFIDSLCPGINKVSVSESTPIEVFFSQDMNSLTLNTNSIKVYGLFTGLIDVGIQYDQVGRKAVVNSPDDFKPGEEIIVCLTSEVKTASDLPIVPTVYSFIVRTTNGNGYLEEHSGVTAPARVTSVSLGDIDSDNDLDLVLKCDTIPSIMVFKNDGTERFTLLSSFGSRKGGNLLLADFSADGDLDIASFTEYGMSLFENSGNGSYIMTGDFMEIGGNAFNDLDGDGDLDIASLSRVVYYGNGSTGIIRNNQNIFVRDTTHSFMDECVSDVSSGVVMEDFQNDGIIDLAEFHTSGFCILSICCGCTSLHYKYNLGDALLFSDSVFYGNACWSEINPEWNMTAFDYDNDQQIEILVSHSEFMFNNVVGDFDSDSDLDMLTDQHRTYRNLTLALNNGQGDFSNRRRIQTANQITFYDNFTSAGDIDNDGDLDAICSFDNRVSLLINKPYYCDISGPGSLPAGNEPQLYHCTLTNGVWSLLNYNNTQAYISSSNSDDSVWVVPGSIPGYFSLNYQSTDTILCSKLISVERPLPVDLVDFNTSVTGADVVLNWATYSEINNAGFEIERTVLPTNTWSRIGQVKGNGSVNTFSKYSYVDRNLQSGIYHYRLKQIDFNGNFEYFQLPEAVTIGVPDKYFVDQNYPNPFNPHTTIAYGIPQAGNVVLKIFDMAGREVKTLVNEYKDAGYYVARFDGSSLSSGTYIYRIESGNFVSAKKMVLLK